MERYNTKRYIDHLKEIASTYNSKTNRTLKLSPNEAIQKVTIHKLYKNLKTTIAKLCKAGKKPKYKIEDRVRISKLPKEGVFRKGYKMTFSEEVVAITKVDLRLPVPRHFLHDSNNEK